MKRGNIILKFIDGTATPEECRELFNDLQENGGIDELLLSDAASLLFYTKEQLSEYFTSEEIEEIEGIRAKYMDLFKQNNGYKLDEDALMVAEDDAPYGE